MRLLLLICVIVSTGWLAGVANAQVIEGTSGPDVINGTNNGDRISGYGGSDTINSKGGGDYSIGGSGADTLDMGCGFDEAEENGGEGLIYVDCADGKPDVVDCGTEHDIVFWRVPGTAIAVNCEDAFHVSGTGDRTRTTKERP